MFKMFSGEKGAVPLWIIVFVVAAVLVVVFLKPIKNRWNLAMCKNKVSVIRKLQQSYYDSNAKFAEHPDDLKSNKNYPKLEPVCIRVGEETEYFTDGSEQPTEWEVRVMVAGEWDGECFVFANKQGTFVEGSCASEKERKKAAEVLGYEEEE
ncbi:MAG TPA: hypothetical protein PLN69_06895 [bacterium]|nr:hypothetical protein [bacterium]